MNQRARSRRRQRAQQHKRHSFLPYDFHVWREELLNTVAFEQRLYDNPQTVIDSLLAFHRDNGTSPVTDLIDLWTFTSLATWRFVNFLNPKPRSLTEDEKERIDVLFLPTIFGCCTSVAEVEYARFKIANNWEPSFLGYRFLPPRMPSASDVPASFGGEG